MPHVALYIVFVAIALASYSCVAKCTELFQRRAASAKPRCKCVVAGQCPNSDYLHQGGGGDGCNLYNNYLTCLKNAQKNFDTVVLNSGELLRRVRAGAGRVSHGGAYSHHCETNDCASSRSEIFAMCRVLSSFR